MTALQVQVAPRHDIRTIINILIPYALVARSSPISPFNFWFVSEYSCLIGICLAKSLY